MFTVSKIIIQSMLKMDVPFSLIKSLENGVPESVMEVWCLVVGDWENWLLQDVRKQKHFEGMCQEEGGGGRNIC